MLLNYQLPILYSHQAPDCHSVGRLHYATLRSGTNTVVIRNHQHMEQFLRRGLTTILSSSIYACDLLWATPPYFASIATLFGAPEEVRTPDSSLKRRVLYQLSYWHRKRFHDYKPFKLLRGKFSWRNFGAE